MTLSTSNQLVARGGSANFNGAVGYLELYARYTQQDIANNRHYVVWTLNLVVSGGYIGTYYNQSKYLNGTDVPGFDVAVDNGNYGSQTLGTIEGWVTHNSDGSKSISGNGGFRLPPWSVTLTVSGGADLPTLPRVSGITNITKDTSRVDFGNEVTFAIDRKANSFTHTLEYTVDGTTYTIGTGLTTSAAHTFPTSLIEKFPSSAKPIITVTCKTYSGTTLIGSANTTVYLYVPDSYVPTITLTTSDSNSISNGLGYWVATRSILQATIMAAGIAGSTISSYSSTVKDSQPFTTSTFSTSINSSGDILVTATVTDSRGRTATATETLSVMPYKIPTLSDISVKRCLVDGTLSDNGTYGKAICTYYVSPIALTNTQSLKITIGTTTKVIPISDYSNTFTATDLFSGLSVNSNYIATFELADSFTTITKTFIITPAFKLISYRAGGKGVTYGQVATQDGFHCYLDADFHGKLLLNGVPVGQQGPPGADAPVNVIVSTAQPSTGTTPIVWVDAR